MANATVQVKVLDVDETRRNRKKICKLSIADGDYVTGGLTIDLTSVENPNNLPAAGFGRNPVFADVMNIATGYFAEIVLGTALDTGWRLKIGSEANGGELSVSAIPAALTSTTTNLYVEFTAPKNL